MVQGEGEKNERMREEEGKGEKKEGREGQEKEKLVLVYFRFLFPPLLESRADPGDSMKPSYNIASYLA